MFQCPPPTNPTPPHPTPPHPTPTPAPFSACSTEVVAESSGGSLQSLRCWGFLCSVLMPQLPAASGKELAASRKEPEAQLPASGSASGKKREKRVHSNQLPSEYQAELDMVKNQVATHVDASASGNFRVLEPEVAEKKHWNSHCLLRLPSTKRSCVLTFAFSPQTGPIATSFPKYQAALDMVEQAVGTQSSQSHWRVTVESFFAGL